MAKTKQSAQKNPSGASLVRRQHPPRSGKAQKMSERAVATADMCRRLALFPSIYADDHENLMNARFGAVASQARVNAPAHAATEVLPPSETREATQIPVFGTFMRMGLAFWVDHCLIN